MKTLYEKTSSRHGEGYTYSRKHGGYHRNIKTFPELRARAGLEADDEYLELGVRPRLARNTARLDPWNDFSCSRDNGKSWKDYTKHRKQWAVGFDPVQDSRPPTGLMASILHMLAIMEHNRSL